MMLFGFIFGIIVCYALPVGGLVLCVRKKKGAGKAFAIGVLTFVISQLLIRIPILQLVLPQFAWFAVLQMNPWAYGLFLGGTAGIFEEVARWIGFRIFLKRQQDFAHGFAFGLGHGGIEAMVLVGLNFIVGLWMMAAGQGALFPADVAGVFLAGGERLYVIAFHVGASLLVLYGIRVRKSLRYLIGAIVLHTVFDAAIVILPYEFGVSTLGVGVYGAVASILTFVVSLLMFRKLECGAEKELISQ